MSRRTADGGEGGARGLSKTVRVPRAELERLAELLTEKEMEPEIRELLKSIQLRLA